MGFALSNWLFPNKQTCSPIVFVVSYPRSGNTMAMWTLAKLLDAQRFTAMGANPFDKAAAPKECENIRLVKDHVARERYADDQVVFIVRDGRDTMISLAYMTLQQHRHKFLEKSELADFIKWLDRDYPFRGWASHMRCVKDLQDKPDKLVVRYEDLIAKPEVFRSVVDFITDGASPPYERIVSAWNDRDTIIESIKNNDRANKAWGLDADVAQGGLYEEWSKNRKGSTWRQSWDSAAKRAFHETGATDFLIEHGFEDDPLWWRL